MKGRSLPTLLEELRKKSKSNKAANSKSIGNGEKNPKPHGEGSAISVSVTNSTASSESNMGILRELKKIKAENREHRKIGIKYSVPSKEFIYFFIDQMNDVCGNALSKYRGKIIFKIHVHKI